MVADGLTQYVTKPPWLSEARLAMCSDVTFGYYHDYHA